MKFKHLGFLLLFSSCNNLDNQELDSNIGEASWRSENIESKLKYKTPSEIFNAKRFQDYFSLFSEKEEVEISEEYKELYIKAALDKINDYYQYDDFKNLMFFYGDVLFKSNDIIVVSFNLTGDDGWNEHDVEFMITYSQESLQMKDAILLSTSSTFESHNEIGYNAAVSLDYELIKVLDDSVAFVLKQSSHIAYYNFNESYYSGEELQPYEEDFELEYMVLNNGEILEE